MESLFSDIRHGFRSLIKRPGVTAVAVITLALGIGADTAIFTLLNAVNFKQLPVLIVVACFAGCLPATKASRVNPLTALGYE